MYQALVITSLFGPILVTGIGIFTCSGENWLLFGTSCYQIGESLDYSDATRACSDLDGYVMMPKTPEEMTFAKSLQIIGGTIKEVWIGLTEHRSNGIWTWADGSVASNQGIVQDKTPNEDCVRINNIYIVYDTKCSNTFVTVCQRDANLETTSNIDIKSSQKIPTTNTKTSEGPTATEAHLFGTTSAHVSTNTETFVESSTSFFRQSETTSYIDITSAQEITTTNTKMVDGPTATEAHLLGTTSAHVSTNTETSDASSTSYIRQLEITSIMDISSSPEVSTTDPLTMEGNTTTEPDIPETTYAHLSTNTDTSFESSTAYSVSSRSHTPRVLSTRSSVFSTNSTQHCTYVFICSNQSNGTSNSAGYTYKVDKKKLSSYKRKHHSASDPRKSSMYIGSVGIAVLVSVVLLIMFLDCVPTKV